MNSLLAERVGSQTPRVANYPPYPLSAAPEVIDLAESAGLYLDDWQKYVLTHGLGHRVDEQWTARKVSVWVPRQNGKGAIIEALELAWLFLFDEELVVHSAHQHRTSQKAYGRLERMIRATPDLHRRVKQYRQANGEQQIELWDGRLLQYTTRSRTAVRGFSAPKLVLDEAQELTSEQMAAMLPTVSAMPNWQVWFFGTPPADSAAWAYGLKDDGEAGAPRLAHFDWGLDLDPDDPEDAATIADIESAYTTNPALGIRIERETVEDEQKPSGLGTEYPAERLGVWRPRAGDGSRVIPSDLWRTLAAPHAERPAEVAFALHVNLDRTRAAVAFAGRRPDGLIQVGLMEWRAGAAWVVDRLVELREKWQPVAVAVDTRSEGLLIELEKAGITVSEDSDEPERGDLVIPTAADTAAAYAQLVDTARAQRLRHSDDAPVNTALVQAKTRELAGGATWDHRGPGESGPLKAVTLAAWAFEARAHLVQADYDPLANIY
jgi:phage terminase large subunit-like protein